MRHPGPAFMVDFLSAWGFRAVTAAFRLGVVDALTPEPRTPAQVAAETNLRPEGVALLLDVLDCLGYVTERDGRYELRPVVRALAPIVTDGVPYFQNVAFLDWNHLEGQLRGDGSRRPSMRFLQDWRVFQRGMVALAGMNLAEVIRRVKVTSRTRVVLDLGGGHGLYSIALCRRYPWLSATVFDIPKMEPIARETIAEHGMADRVNYRAGDFFLDDLPPSDLVLLFNVIHSKSEEENRQVLRRAVESLNPGGSVVLLDQFPSARLGNIGRAFGSLMALSMFLNVSQRTYRPEEVRDWFRAEGLRRVRFRGLRSAPGNALVVGRKEG